MPELRICRLNERQLTQAYPLIRSTAQVSRERWEAFGRGLIADGGGILAVRARGGCIHGLAAFRRLGSLRHDLSLQVEIMVAFELSRLAPVRKALYAALEKIARGMSCHSIAFVMTARDYIDPTPASLANWEEQGLKMETVGLVRRIRPEESRS